MSWARAITGIIALGLAALCTGSAAAQAIVLRSTGPSARSYPMGRKLDANAAVLLQNGDKVTVLDKLGTRVLFGPGSFRLEAVVRRDVGTLGALAVLTKVGVVRTRTGAVRENDEPEAAHNIWFIDASKGGQYCLSDPKLTSLWRPARKDPAISTLRNGDSREVSVNWPAGVAVRQWPAAEMPLVEGGTYTIANVPGDTVRVSIHLLGPLPEQQVDRAALLAEKGCTAQLALMADAVEAVNTGTAQHD